MLCRCCLDIGSEGGKKRSHASNFRSREARPRFPGVPANMNRRVIGGQSNNFLICHEKTHPMENLIGRYSSDDTQHHLRLSGVEGLQGMDEATRERRMELLIRLGFSGVRVEGKSSTIYLPRNNTCVILLFFLHGHPRNHYCSSCPASSPTEHMPWLDTWKKLA